MTAADEFDDVWAEAAALFEENLWSDDYAVKRPEEVEDSSGGYTSTLSTLETGKCSLEVDETQSGERQANGLLVTTSTYRASLPRTTVAQTGDTLVINGRTFNVVDIKVGGHWATEAEARLEEAG